jgi:hypothetical protein
VSVVPSAVSPGLLASIQPEVPAYELKFMLDSRQAHVVEDWARRHLILDPHGDLGLGGAYLIHSLYLDTPTFDVFWRCPSYRRRKYRLRRYGEESVVYLERKTRDGDQVRKRRSSIAGSELATLQQPDVISNWPGEWFHRRVSLRRLVPALHVDYRRLAFISPPQHESARLTLDRDLHCVPAVGWSVQAPHQGLPLAQGQVVLELKYRGTLPALFRRLLHETALCPGPMSKYRRGMAVWHFPAGGR